MMQEILEEVMFPLESCASTQVLQPVFCHQEDSVADSDDLVWDDARA